MDDWISLSTRIKGLVQAGLLYAQMFATHSGDPYGGGRRIAEQAKQIFDELDQFSQRREGWLSPSARDALRLFLNERRSLFYETGGTPDSNRDRMKASIISLAAFESELSFLLSNTQELVRRRSELAFLHLQRCIVVDEAFRNKWKKAFEIGEVACERQGAVHLLQHGIWAFKIGSTGARTDLVFNEPLRDRDIKMIYKAAEGLVLTEWKVAKKPSDIPSQFEAARRQACLYEEGALAGIELTGYRYAVVVTGRQARDYQDDISDRGVIFRHINIAVDPLTPSRA